MPGPVPTPGGDDADFVNRRRRSCPACSTGCTRTRPGCSTCANWTRSGRARSPAWATRRRRPRASSPRCKPRRRRPGRAGGTRARPEPEEPAQTLDELLAELDALVGLGTVKAEIHRQTAVLKVDALRTRRA
ncbi:MAG: hypothetical protein R2719_02990 [Micropruina sp.]